MPSLGSFLTETPFFSVLLVFFLTGNAMLYGDLSVILLAVSHRAGPRFKPGNDQASGKRANILATPYFYFCFATALLIHAIPLLSYVIPLLQLRQSLA